jgi:hypothetical protein
MQILDAHGRLSRGKHRIECHARVDDGTPPYIVRWLDNG